MAKLPYMPWYPADLLSSSDYALMSPLERLAYRELLDRCWMSGGTLPADAEMLSRLTVGDVSDAVLAKFIEIDGTDTITNVRLWAEYERAEARHDALSQAGRKGGQSKATSQAKATPQAGLKRGHKPGSSIQNQNQNQISSKEDSTPVSKDTVPKGTAPNKFIKPTVEEVAAYCTERSKGVDPEAWFDHYTANGWKVGKNPMKDWKATVRTWERNQFGTTAKRSTANPRTYTQGGGKQWDGVPTL